MSDAVWQSCRAPSGSAYRFVELGAQAILKRGHPFQQESNTEQVDLQHHQLHHVTSCQVGTNLVLVHKSIDCCLVDEGVIHTKGARKTLALRAVHSKLTTRLSYASIIDGSLCPYEGRRKGKERLHHAHSRQ